MNYQTIPANASADSNTAECGHPLDDYCGCFADAMEAELDADFGPDDALRETYA